MNQTWMIDPKTGDYVLDSKGKPVLHTGLLVPAYIRLKARRTAWMYQPDDSWGSDFHLITRRVTTKDNTLVESIAEKALQPLISDGRAMTIDIQPKEYTRHTGEINIKIVDAQGQVEQLEFLPIGLR